jgi:hypothetical protein
MKLRSTILFILFSFTTFLFFGRCTTQPKADPAGEIETLAFLQKQEQDAHLQESPALLVNMLHDTLVQIKNGEVSYYTKDQMTERFITYFENVEFFKWEDTHPPVYTLSADATMANILNRKIVILNDVTGAEPVRDTTLFAWTELWKKKDGRWKMYQVTTTDVRK